MFMILDNAILQGQPHFPHDMVEVSGVIKEHHVRFVYIDRWVSSGSGGLRFQNTQDARHAIDPLLSQSITLRLVLAVAHPNRAEGDIRARVGRAAVLRQAAPVLLFAIDRQTMTRS
jgi:hypothetical protein